MVVGRDEVAEVVRWSEGIERVHQCIAGRFRRPKPRRRAMEYLKGLLSPVERKDGWQLAVLVSRKWRRQTAPSWALKAVAQLGRRVLPARSPNS